ncbi:MAG: hypothetical protein GDYSWBUE_000415 [Candidatus Fervidibacterota bacterium]
MITMRKAKRQRLRSLVEFLAGIIIVVGAIGFYQLGKGVIGPYLRSRISPATGTMTTDTTGLSREDASQAFVRSDMALIPNETTVTIEPIYSPAGSEERSQNVSEPSETAPEVTREEKVETQPSESGQPQPTPSPPQGDIKVTPTTKVSQPERTKPAVTYEPRSGGSETVGEQSSSESGTISAPPGSVKRRYHVQVGLFRLKENADKLVQELISKGYQPFVEVTKTPTGETYRIIVGAFDERSDAERLAQELDEIGMKAIVRDVGGR